MLHSWVQVLRYLHSTAAAPSKSSAEAVIHLMFRPLALYTLGIRVHSGNQALCVGVNYKLLLPLFNQIRQDYLSDVRHIFPIAVHLSSPDTLSAENKSKKKKSSPRGHRIYNVSRPFLSNQYCIFSLGELCLGVEKKTLKECMHFHYMTYARWIIIFTIMIDPQLDIITK